MNKKIQDPLNGKEVDSDEDIPQEAKDHEVSESVRDGPSPDRRLTDCWCTMVFLFTAIAGVGLSVKAYSTGNYDEMVAPIDSDNRLCGFSSDVVDYPYLYIFNITDAIESASLFKYGVCVNECPNNDNRETFECIDTSFSSTYADGCETPNGDGDDTYDFFGYCVPQGPDADAVYDQIRDLMSDLGFSFLIDIQTTETTILIGVGTSVLFSLIYIWLMHKLAKYIAWVVIVAFEVLIISGALYTFSQASAQEDTDEQQKYTYFAYFLFGVAAVYALAVCCMCSAINLAAHIMDAAADFVIDTIRVVFVPLSFFLFSLAFFCVWIFGFISVLAQGEVGTDTDDVDYSTQTKTITWTSSTVYEALFMIFCLIWVFCFFQACSQFVVIVASATWFWSWKKEKGEREGDGDASVNLGYYWAFRYHLGSIAFGSFILAVIWIVQITFELFKKAAKKSGASDNAIAQCFLKCLTCLIQCIKKCVEYINENAYIEMAISSDSFCTSAKNGMCLMLKYSSRFLMTSGIGRIFGFIGKAVINVANLFFIYILLTQWSINDDMISASGPLFVVFVFTWITSDIFVGVFTIAADTFLHCFIMEEDLCSRDGNSIRQLPEGLESFMAQNRKQKKSDNQPDRNQMA